MNYYALRSMRVSENGRVREVEPGQSVDVSSWSPYVLRANLSRSYIEQRDGEVEAVSDNGPELPFIKLKNKGGRPRKKPLETVEAETSTELPSA